MSAHEYSVRIEPHGRTLRVREDQSVLEVALAAGLNLPHSCRSGHCASCKARLLSGRDSLSERANRRPYRRGGGAAGTCSYVRPDRDRTCGSRRASSRMLREAEIKILPCRIATHGAAGAGCDAGVPAAAGGRAAAVPGRAVSRCAGRRRRQATQLFDRESAARQRARSSCTCATCLAAGSRARCSRSCGRARCCGSRGRSGSSSIAIARRRR